MSAKRKNLVGQKFNRLYVFDFAEMVNGDSFFWCECECGNKKKIRAYELINGTIKSCGCLLKEWIQETKKTHGMSGTIEYRTHSRMLERCNNPSHSSYFNYGGRGIFVCDRWQGKDGFINFFSDMGPRPGKGYSIDRIDNNGPYSPENCRWVTQKEQNNNYRQNRCVEIDGITKNITEWAEVYGVSRDVIYCRIQKGWDLRRAVITPVQKYVKRKRRNTPKHI